MERRPASTAGHDGAVVLGQVAGLLADLGQTALPDALALLVEALGLRSAVLRGPGPDGAVIALAGEVVHAVPLRRSAAPLTTSGPPHEVPVVHSGREQAVLVLHGARPSHLAVLRAAAGVLGLALSVGRRPTADPLGLQLVCDAEADRDALADALHDGAVQSLVVARYAADAAVRAGDPHGSVALVRDSVQDALVEIRRTLWQLRPRAADDLAGALTELSARLVDAGAPALELDLDEAVLSALPHAVSTTAFRLVQAVAATGAGPVRVRSVVTSDGPAVEVHGNLDGSPDGSFDTSRWRRRAEAVGAVLQPGSGHMRLLSPAPRLLPVRSAVPAGDTPSRTTRPKATT
ncbi:MAG: histidine kinase [Mycobacteriales bacterium]|nr:histidine kinase [Mycobacteriales bacterium]